jgi:hypothetical protein
METKSNGKASVDTLDQCVLDRVVRETVVPIRQTNIVVEKIDTSKKLLAWMSTSYDFDWREYMDEILVWFILAYTNAGRKSVVSSTDVAAPYQPTRMKKKQMSNDKARAEPFGPICQPWYSVAFEETHSIHVSWVRELCSKTVLFI